MKVLFDLIPKKQEEMVLFQVHEKVPFLTSIADILEKYKVETILVRDYKKERDVYLDLFSIFYIEYLALIANVSFIRKMKCMSED